MISTEEKRQNIVANFSYNFFVHYLIPSSLCLSLHLWWRYAKFLSRLHLNIVMTFYKILRFPCAVCILRFIIILLRQSFNSPHNSPLWMHAHKACFYLPAIIMLILSWHKALLPRWKVQCTDGGVADELGSCHMWYTTSFSRQQGSQLRWACNIFR